MTGRGTRGREIGRKGEREGGKEGGREGQKKAMIYCDKVNLARNSFKSKEILLVLRKNQI